MARGRLWILSWLMVFMVGAIGGRCFTILWSVVGFFIMGGGQCFTQYMVGGRWSVVGGWLVVSIFVLRHGNIVTCNRKCEEKFQCL